MAGFTVAAVMAGCSSAPVINSLNVSEKKVEAVKIAKINTIDLGHKGGATANVNIKFKVNKQSFGIKAFNPGFSSNGAFPIAGTEMVIKIHKFATGGGPGGTSQARFDSATSITRFIPIPNAAEPFKLTNLNPASDYYISARFYAPEFTAQGYTVTTAVGNTVTVNGSISSISDLSIKYGDLIDVGAPGGTIYRVVSTTATTFDVSPALNPGVDDGLTTSPTLRIRRNVVADDGSGGMGAASDVGGGTAAGEDDGTGGEEFIIVSDEGVVSISGDAPANNTQFDMSIQLMKDLGAMVDGTVQTNPGDPLAGSEGIS